MASAFSQLTDALSHRPPPSRAVKEDDECDFYAKLLAKKIQELMMYEVDGLFIKLRSFPRDTPSPIFNHMLVIILLYIYNSINILSVQI